MKLWKLLLFSLYEAYTPPKDYSSELDAPRKTRSKCGALTSADFWSPGHAVESCTDTDNNKSVCKIKCVAPYVSLSKNNPHKAWEVQCKGGIATWKAVWQDRPNNDCFFCPQADLQQRPFGAKLLDGWSSKKGVKIGQEIRLRFNIAKLEDTCKEGFIFALKFKTFVLPEDATIEMPGASVSSVSPDRSLITFEPAYTAWRHDFWHNDKHDGTRAFIYASNLDELVGQYQAQLYVFCQDFGTLGQKVTDLTCLATAGDQGIPYQSGEECPEFTTVVPPTETTKPEATPDPSPDPTTEPTTTQTTEPTTEPGSKPTFKPTTPPTTGTTGTTPYIPNECVLHGSHTLGNSPNWWPNGNTWSYQGYVSIPIDGSVEGGWSVEISFKKPMSSIQFWSGAAQKMDSQGYIWKFSGADQTYWHAIEFTYIGEGVPSEGGNEPATAWNGNQQIIYCQEDGPNPGTTTTQKPGGTTAPPTTGTTTGGEPLPTNIPGCVDELPAGWQNSRCHSSLQQGYCVANPAQTEPNFKSGASDYEKLLHLSILFYEAQRSGPLPSSSRIPWRGQSALKDGCDVGHDLTGGWYDAGDFVKFNFPMSYSVTTLAWGMISFEAGYKLAGEWNNAVDSIKFVTDYLIRCHTKKNEFWGQVANGGVDHSYWGRPEEYSHDRPSYKIDANNPGSDLAGEASAALSAASIVFAKNGDTAAANEALQHARELFEFADNYRGTYTSGIPDAGSYYNSWSGYQDELVWAAAWLARASGEASDRQLAETRYNSLNGAAREDYSWDNKKMGAQIVMYEATGKETYKATVQKNVEEMISSGPYTPGGMIYKQQWGPARHAANAAFIAMQAAASGITKNANKNFAKSQVDYLKGGNPQNQCFIVGFGGNCPRRPHHRSSSCPATGECGWDAYNNVGDNPFVLYGALVGGPNQNDQYTDDRGDYIANEVATDYNAAWQGALAGLIQM